MFFELIENLHLSFFRGTPPRNSTVPVTIVVEDENDSPPVFPYPIYYVTLPEDTPVNTSIFLTLNATDADQGANAELEYLITSGNHLLLSITLKSINFTARNRYFF